MAAPDLRGAWHEAFAALRPVDGPDVRGMPEGMLLHLRDTYPIETAWAPKWVDDELRQPSGELAEALDERLKAGGTLRALAPDRAPSRHQLAPARDDGAIADEIAALDLIRQAEASQVGGGRHG